MYIKTCPLTVEQYEVIMELLYFEDKEWIDEMLTIKSYKERKNGIVLEEWVCYENATVLQFEDAILFILNNIIWKTK